MRRNVGYVIVGLLALFFIAIIFIMKSSMVPEPGLSYDTNNQKTPIMVTNEGAFKLNNEGIINPESHDNGTRVDIFFDLHCPACQQMHEALNETITELTENNKAEFYYSPIVFLDDFSTDNYSTRASNAFITIAEHAPEFAKEYLNILYKNQPNVRENYVPITDTDLINFAISVGVPIETAELIQEQFYIEWIKDNSIYQETRKDVFPERLTTPTILIHKNNEKEPESFHRMQFENDYKKEFTSIFKEIQEGNI